MKFSFALKPTDLTTNEASDVQNLQAQINALGTNGTGGETMGPDTIISKGCLIWKVVHHFTCFIFLAIYTQLGGAKITTVKNALSDLYNITNVENNLIMSMSKKQKWLYSILRIFSYFYKS